MAAPGIPAPLRSFRTELASAPESARAARRWTASRLEGICPPEVRADAMLAVSELVTNAVQAHGRHPRSHGRRRVEVMIIVIDRTVRLEVRDGASSHPVLARPSDDDERGRGLQVVASVASHWGYRAGPGGKVVWCDLQLPAGADTTVHGFDPELMIATTLAS